MKFGEKYRNYEMVIPFIPVVSTTGPRGWAVLPGHLPNHSSPEVLGRLAPFWVRPRGCSLVFIKYHKLRINSCQKQMFSPCYIVNTNALRHSSSGHGRDVRGLSEASCSHGKAFGLQGRVGKGKNALILMLTAPSCGDIKLKLADQGGNSVCPHPGRN